MQNEFPNAKNVCYLSTASEGILPLTSCNALSQAASLIRTPQKLGEEQFYDLPARCRRLLAQMHHCSPEEIALTASTSLGLTAVALSLPLRKGDEVLLVENDFPSNNFSWEGLAHDGVVIRKAPFSPDAEQTSRLLESVTPATRAISVSLVHSSTGYLYDLQLLSDFCRGRNIFLIFDAVQAAGTIELDLEKLQVTALSAAGYKWQLAPAGTGFLYVNRNAMPQMKPFFHGWLHNNDVSSMSELDFHRWGPSRFAWRFELGVPAYTLLAAYEQSLKLLLECKIAYIENHNARLTSRLCDLLRAQLGWPVPDYPRSPSILSIVPPPPHSADQLGPRLESREVFVSVRSGRLRIAPHLYNTEQDIDRLAAELKRLL